jgi:arylsulfatase A-like enzyme
VPTETPHIIYLISDEHRGQAMGHAGDPNVETPSMDRLAREGVSFARAYANCPICTPSRGTMFSGRHAHAGPVAGFFDNYKASAPSTATILREAGYHTAYVGKWHCGIVRDQLPPLVKEKPEEFKGSAQRTPERHRAGFQDWFGFENLNQHFASFTYRGDDVNPTKTPGYETDGLTEMVLEYLAAYDREEPLFLVLSVTPPHFPMLVPEAWRRHDPQALSVRPNFNEELPDGRENLAKYYAMIENLDWNWGRVLEALERLPRFAGRTLTVYFSDHGEYMGSHERQARKEHPHEESVRIPALWHWPEGIPPQGSVPGLFSLVDLLPTTLGLAGVPVPPHVQGFDWSPRLRGEQTPGPEAVLLEMVGNPRWNLDFLDWRGIVTEKWKYAVYETGEEMLFDLEADPYEMQNLAGTDHPQRPALRRELLAALAESREPYFDVLLEHGAPQDKPDIDVAAVREEHPGLEE